MANTTFILAATGGIEEPSFQAFTDEQAARAKFQEWSQDLLKGVGNRLDLLRVDGTACITSLESAVADDDDDEDPFLGW